MKRKLFVLKTIMASCILSLVCNTAFADDMNSNNNDSKEDPKSWGSSSQQSSSFYTQQRGMVNQANPSEDDQMQPVGPNGQRPCYPASKCIGNPYTSTQNYQSQTQTYTKPLSIESSEQFSGSVKAVNRIQMPDQTQVQMVLATDRGDVLVILGPATYIDQQKIKFQAGDQVVVSGYRVTANGQDVIIAASIQKNGNALQLLDERRQPVWGSTSGSQGYIYQGRGPMSPGYSQGATYQRYSYYNYSPNASQYSSNPQSYSQYSNNNPSYSQYSNPQTYSQPTQSYSQNSSSFSKNY